VAGAREPAHRAASSFVPRLRLGGEEVTSARLVDQPDNARVREG
jgi:hypothetical protein